MLCAYSDWEINYKNFKHFRIFSMQNYAKTQTNYKEL
jgi:hypothetical protein